MPRLIDADALEKEIEEITKEPDYQHEGEDWSVGVIIAQSAVQDAPTIEAVPVENIKRIVERLGEMKMRYFLTIANSGSANLDSVYEEVGNCIDRAIEIVKEEGMK